MQRTRIELDRIPPSTNHYWGITARRGFVKKYVTKDGKDFKEYIIRKWYAWKITENPVKMRIKLQFPTRRRCDIDNYNKALLDVLQGIIYKDDNQIIELHLTKHYLKGVPKTIIDIEELKGE